MSDFLDPKQKEMLAHFSQINASSFGRCLYPPMSCKDEPIRAHTIQNGRVLEIIAKNGHVIGLVRRINKEKGPVIEFKPVSRNEASTFTGLCSTHDQNTFNPIDNKWLNPDNTEQLFLLAYRAVLRELHATMEGAMKVQASYQKRVKLGLSQKDQPSHEGMQAIERFMVAYETHQYKSLFDQALLNRDYSNIEHKVFILPNQRPTVAASSLFSLNKLKIENDVVRVCLNIVPVRNKTTIVVFSYHKKDSELAKGELNYIFSSQEHYQKYEISRALLNYCENFFIEPGYFKEWSEEKKNEIREYYVKTILHNNLEYNNENLYLF